MKPKAIIYELARQLIGKGLNTVGPTLAKMSLKTYDINQLIFKDVGAEILSTYFSKMPVSLALNHVAKFEGMDYPIEFKDEWSFTQGDFVDFTWYKHTLIILKIHCANDKDRGWTREYKIQCFDNKHDVAMTRDFLKKLSYEIRQKDTEVAATRYTISRKRYMIDCPDRPMRNWTNVFVPEAIRDELCTSIHKFAESVEWYRAHEIPYHFGILLHGNPGTGKSSIVQALCNEIPSDIVVIHPGELWDALDEDVFRNYRSLSRHLFVIIEDIDTNVIEKRRTRNNTDYLKQESDPELLGKLLNYIDGLGSPDGVIWIMTTNHLEKLDPALIRPGRIDVSVEIGYVDDETFAQFTKFHYGRTPININVRSGFTFAQLQTYVMKGMSFDDLCDLVKD